MELKVWVEGVARVVCGLSPDTSCRDVVISLAQAIGQTGRYILVMKLHGTERHLVAEDRPLQHLAQLGQLAAEVQFILWKTGPSLSEGPNTPTRERRVPRHRSSEPQPLETREPSKAFPCTSSANPRRTKPNRSWSPSPRASPEPRASPVSFLDPTYPVKETPSSPSKEEEFRQILQQQRELEDLEVQLQSLERESDVWERGRPPASAPSPTPGELEGLEEQLRQNEAELMLLGHWEKQFQTETDREREMHRRLQQMNSSVEDHCRQILELQARSSRLQEDLHLRAHRQSSRAEQEEVLRPLNQELHHRLQQADDLDATLSETQRELRTAEDRLQDRWETVEELNKELRQCQLQQFIQQSGAPHADQMASQPAAADVYISSAGIVEQQRPGHRYRLEIKNVN